MLDTSVSRPKIDLLSLFSFWTWDLTNFKTNVLKSTFIIILIFSFIHVDKSTYKHMYLCIHGAAMNICHCGRRGAIRAFALLRGPFCWMEPDRLWSMWLNLVNWDFYSWYLLISFYPTKEHPKQILVESPPFTVSGAIPTLSEAEPPY